MRTKNLTPKRLIFVAQAKIEKLSHKETRKAWPRASKKGWCTRGVVLLQIVWCFIAVQCICWQINSCHLCNVQKSENIFAQKVQSICHQGQHAEHTAKVGNLIAKKHQTQSVHKTNFNVCLQRCDRAYARISQRWKSSWNAENESQKPSQVNGVLEMRANGTKVCDTRGLITPTFVDANKRKRLAQICSMTAQVKINRQRRMHNKRLLAEEQRRQAELAAMDETTSLRKIQQLSSSSNSSDEEETLAKTAKSLHSTGKTMMKGKDAKNDSRREYAHGNLKLSRGSGGGTLRQAAGGRNAMGLAGTNDEDLMYTGRGVAEEFDEFGGRNPAKYAGMSAEDIYCDAKIRGTGTRTKKRENSANLQLEEHESGGFMRLRRPDAEERNTGYARFNADEMLYDSRLGGIHGYSPRIFERKHNFKLEQIHGKGEPYQQSQSYLRGMNRRQLGYAQL